MPKGPPNFCADLVADARAATIIHPLSDAALTCLDEHLERGSPTQDPTQYLLTALKRMISCSEKLWDSSHNRAVLKLSDSLVAKIIRGNNDYTEYTSLQYLQEHAPELPVPKPHGLIRFHTVQIMFMTYIPSLTLEEVWNSLTHENKTLLQSQLDEFISNLRLLKYNRHCLGGVSGEGVKLNHNGPHDEVITTVAEFEDLKFLGSPGSQPATTSWVNFLRSFLPAPKDTTTSWVNFLRSFLPAPNDTTTSWVNFLRSFLPAPKDTVVFAHGDLRPANIMVTLRNDGNYELSGVIDWEDSGFYPEYHESTSLLYTFGMRSEDDWYAYLPPSISPVNHPERWLVARLWDTTGGSRF